MRMVLFLWASALVVGANDVHWPQFRGPHGSGVGTGDFPTHFGPGSNVVWKITVPSGHSSPCIWNDCIFLTGFADGRLQVLCIDRHQGGVIWQRAFDAEKIEHGASLGSPATATPVTDGEHVFVYFGSLGLVALDFKGGEFWRKPLAVPITQHGAGTSPVLAGDRLILNCDQDVDSYLLAVDKHSGQTLWRTDRAAFRRGFSTPLLFPPTDPNEVILAGTLRLVSYDLQTGTENWSVAGLPNEMVTSPIAGPDFIFITGWTPGAGVSRMPAFDALLASGDVDQDQKLTRAESPSGPAKQHFLYIDANKDGFVTRSEYQAIADVFDKSHNIAMAVRSGGKGDVTETHVLWKHTRGLPYCPSPLLYADKVFLVKNGGLATCFDARTGAVFYQEERLGALGDYYSSPVASAGKICVISQPGTAVVFRADKSLEVLARNSLGGPVMATPAIGDGKLYVRTKAHLFAFGEGSPNTMAGIHSAERQDVPTGR